MSAPPQHSGGAKHDDRNKEKKRFGSESHSIEGRKFLEERGEEAEVIQSKRVLQEDTEGTEEEGTELVEGSISVTSVTSCLKKIVGLLCFRLSSSRSILPVSTDGTENELASEGISGRTQSKRVLQEDTERTEEEGTELVEGSISVTSVTSCSKKIVGLLCFRLSSSRSILPVSTDGTENERASEGISGRTQSKQVLQEDTEGTEEKGTELVEGSISVTSVASCSKKIVGLQHFRLSSSRSILQEGAEAAELEPMLSKIVPSLGPASRSVTFTFAPTG